MPAEPPYTPGLAWTFLVCAGILEIAWAAGLKYSDGFTRVWPSVITIGLMVMSFLLLAQALRTIPIGTGYAVWTGIGTLGSAVVGIVLFREPATAVRMACIGLIVAGIVGLKVFSPAVPERTLGGGSDGGGGAGGSSGRVAAAGGFSDE